MLKTAVLLLLLLQTATISLGQMASDFSVKLNPESVDANKETNVTVTILKKDVPQKWSDLKIASGRKIHVVFAHESLSTLLHIHPEDFAQIQDSTAEFKLKLKLPFSGKYAVGFDFLPNPETMNHAGHQMPSGEHSAMVEKLVKFTVTGNSPAPPIPANDPTMHLVGLPLQANDVHVDPLVYSELANVSAQPNPSLFRVDAITIREQKKFVKNECNFLKFQYFTKSGGEPKPVDEIKKFLENDAHVTIVKSDLSVVKHVHGYQIAENVDKLPCQHTELPSVKSSFIGLGVELSEPGDYRVFLQSAVGNYLLAPSFPLTVENGSVESDNRVMAVLTTSVSIAGVAVLLVLAVAIRRQMRQKRSWRQLE
ncbi:hypothetical protein BKA69DRAFT_1101465 [Paraphysoderma sedebokerense]|nr:hypothetical protein BKA69DRAFT_1101465 [Paraphysoderma sedebokerense]